MFQSDYLRGTNQDERLNKIHLILCILFASLSLLFLILIGVVLYFI